ncbi:MAG: hypothetical protein E7576_17405 [Ruminococcaceae bacterium]|jgi:hypothetical protein|nr:hypothetical protein [Oscillospiraceae bacterium]
MSVKHVFLIGVDGAGAFFRNTDTPHIDEIFKNGAVSYDVLTSNPTISAECWGSMLTGVTPEVHGLTNSIVGSVPYPTTGDFPSVFRVIREAMPDAELAAFSLWWPINTGIIEEGLGVTKETSPVDDADLCDKICAYLEDPAHEPTFFFVQFDNVDHWGHASGYGTERHLEQIRTTDGFVGRIWDIVKARGWADDSLFIVTADHGGFDHGHGGWTDGEKYVMFAAAGPDVAKGTIGEMGIRDSASIVLHALGLDDRQPVSWTARVPSGLFKGVEAKERPVGMEKPLPKPEFEHRLRQPADCPAGKSVTDLFPAEDVAAFFPFDGDLADACGKVVTERGGKLYFVDGWFSAAVEVQDGCVTLKDLDLGRESFTAAFWMKTDPASGDPVILGNKDWNSGKNPGFALNISSGMMNFNASDGEIRSDAKIRMPADYMTGWMYVAAAVDRKANEARFSFDFGPMKAVSLADGAKGASFSTDLPLNIGSDGTGAYKCKLPAALDEFLILRRALTDEDVAGLKEYYLG